MGQKKTHVRTKKATSLPLSPLECIRKKQKELRFFFMDALMEHPSGLSHAVCYHSFETALDLAESASCCGKERLQLVCIAWGFDELLRRWGLPVYSMREFFQRAAHVFLNVSERIQDRRFVMVSLFHILLTDHAAVRWSSLKPLLSMVHGYERHYLVHQLFQGMVLASGTERNRLLSYALHLVTAEDYRFLKTIAGSVYPQKSYPAELCLKCAELAAVDVSAHSQHDAIQWLSYYTETLGTALEDCEEQVLIENGTRIAFILRRIGETDKAIIIQRRLFRTSLNLTDLTALIALEGRENAEAVLERERILLMKEPRLSMKMLLVLDRYWGCAGIDDFILDNSSMLNDYIVIGGDERSSLQPVVMNYLEHGNNPLVRTVLCRLMYKAWMVYRPNHYSPEDISKWFAVLAMDAHQIPDWKSYDSHEQFLQQITDLWQYYHQEL